MAVRLWRLPPLIGCSKTTAAKDNRHCHWWTEVGSASILFIIVASSLETLGLAALGICFKILPFGTGWRQFLVSEPMSWPDATESGTTLPNSRMDLPGMMGPVAIHRPLGVDLTQGNGNCVGHVSGLSRSYHVTFSHSHTHCRLR